MTGVSTYYEGLLAKHWLFSEDFGPVQLQEPGCLPNTVQETSRVRQEIKKEL